MISGIHISSSDMVIAKDAGKKNKLPIFAKNQIVHAKVLNLLPQGGVQLLINGQKVAAKTALLLKPGEEVQLKVLEEKDAVLLKLMGPVQKMTTTQISSLINFFSKNESIPDISRTIIAGVKELLYEMALKSDKPDKNFLPKLIDKSGIVWEKKVAQILINSKPSEDMKAILDILQSRDMKGNILKALLASDPRKPEAMKMAASFSETIENFQLLNHSSSESGRFLLPFPVFSESGFNFGQLLIDTGDKTKKDNKDADKLIRISFLLDMTRLGPLRADFSILKNEITGRFLLKDDDTCQYVKSMIPELKEKLAKIDYQVHQIECIIGSNSQIQQSHFIETLVKAREDQVLNIVI